MSFNTLITITSFKEMKRLFIIVRCVTLLSEFSTFLSDNTVQKFSNLVSLIICPNIPLLYSSIVSLFLNSLYEANKMVYMMTFMLVFFINYSSTYFLVSQLKDLLSGGYKTKFLIFKD